MSRSPQDETTELAQKVLDILEQQLTNHLPEGVTTSEVAGVFQRQRLTLVAALVGMLDGIAKRQSDCTQSLTAVSGSDRVLAELERLLDDGEEHQLVVLSGEDFHRFSITPDVDGLYVAIEGRQDKERKLDTTDAAALLDFLADVYPPAAGGVLIAVHDSFALLQESELPSVRTLYDSLVADGRPPDVAFELAVRIHRAVTRVRADAWRGVRAREQAIKGAVFEVLKDIEGTERIFQVVKCQSAY